jgi:ATP-dependent protease HslVU (ClpYQ) ATPase subunit
MGPATEHIWHALRKSVREDLPGFQFAPLLLLGPPGIGKSHWTRRLGKLLEVPTTVVEANSQFACSLGYTACSFDAFYCAQDRKGRIIIHSL